MDAARRFFGQVRDSVEIGETITNPAHALAVAELFRGHAEHTEKAGCGVKQFFVFYAPDHPNSTCFWIERLDGSKTDFGFSACVQTVAGLNRQSLRALVRGQISTFREQRLAECDGTFISDYSGKEFPIAEAHVDHEITFEEIVIRFGEREGLNVEGEMLTVTCDERSEPTWKDQGVAERFLVFHSEFPLRLVSKQENLSELRKRAS